MDLPDGTSTSTSATLVLLENETPYNFRVPARNSVGWGPWSNTTTSTPEIPATAPDAPTITSALPGPGR